VYIKAQLHQKLAAKYTPGQWHQSEVSGAREVPERDRPPLS
jgi:hypothetical protein